MPTLLTVCHGQASYGAADCDVLSERGAEHTSATREALRARGVEPATYVYRTLSRQRDTARPWGVEPRVDARWDEYPLNRVAVNGAVAKVVGGRRGTTLLCYDEHAHLKAGGRLTFR